MASMIRLAAFAAVVTQFACSGTSTREEAENTGTLTPFDTLQGSAGSNATSPLAESSGPGSSAAPGETPGNGSAGTSGSEAPGELPLNPSTNGASPSSAGNDPAPDPMTDPAVDPVDDPSADDPSVDDPPAEEPPPAQPPPVFSTDRSSLPVPPVPAGQPVPSGAPGGLEVLDWAGFNAAVSYTFDDTNQTQSAASTS